jgi:hypothetical protein
MDRIAVAGLVIGSIGAAAAVAAAIYARASPTKADLKRVEDNTAESARHIDAVRNQLAEQDRRDGLISRAQRVSISVFANDRASQPLTLRFRLKESQVCLSRIDLINRANMYFGTFACKREEDGSFSASVDAAVAAQWFNSGEPSESFNRRAVQIRAFLTIDTQELYRVFTIHMLQGIRPRLDFANLSEDVWLLDGAC